MGKHRAIPPGYMTVGEVAKKMNTTVRTIQYYDKEGVLSPSAESEGGRRLYTDKDIIKLYQIQSLKYLGFSLDNIKLRLNSLDTPADVANALSEQAQAVREKIASLDRTLQTIEALKKETLQMQSVNFKRYADIIVNLQMNNEMYWLIKHIDDKALDHLRSRFDEKNGLEIMDTFKRLCNDATQLQNDNVPPEGERGQLLAKLWWDMVMEYTGGDMTMLPKLIESTEKEEDADDEWKDKLEVINQFIGPALEAYFTKQGINPFEGAEQ